MTPGPIAHGRLTETVHACNESVQRRAGRMRRACEAYHMLMHTQSHDDADRPPARFMTPLHAASGGYHAPSPSKSCPSWGPPGHRSRRTGPGALESTGGNAVLLPGHLHRPGSVRKRNTCQRAPTAPGGMGAVPVTVPVAAVVKLGKGCWEWTGGTPGVPAPAQSHAWTVYTHGAQASGAPAA